MPKVCRIISYSVTCFAEMKNMIVLLITYFQKNW